MKNYIKYITPICGKQIFKSVIRDGIVTSFYCHELVTMGKNCHDKMVEYIAHAPEFQAHLVEYLAKGKEAYKSCSIAIVPPTRSIKI